MRLIPAAIIVAYLVSCSPPPAEPPPNPRAAEQVGDAHPLPRTLPAPSAGTPRFVGLWAASADGCSDPAWRFEAQRVTTQGEVSCTFNTVQMTSTGYLIQGTCTAEGPPAPQQIQLSFAESARAMMVSGGPWTPVGLTYCGPLQ
jgi:hypothetical protein